MKILLVKLSSMGDVIHNLPVVADIAQAHPGAIIDWVVEEAYADLLRLHPGIRCVIPVALRRWRKTWLSAKTFRERRAFWQALRAERYDAIIDTQGLFKSAWIARQARGVRHGWRGEACREPLAAWLYNRRYVAPRFDTLPSVQRYRNLAATALAYQAQGAPRYGLDPAPRKPVWLGGVKRYAVLLTATARAEKLWPEDDWLKLAQALVAQRFTVLLAWGNAMERDRAMRIARAAQEATQANRANRMMSRPIEPTPAVEQFATGPVLIAPAPQSLQTWAEVLVGASVVIGVDTGLTFLAAAVGAPVVAIYTATSPIHVGVEAATPHCNLGEIGKPPSAEAVIEATQRLIG